MEIHASVQQKREEGRTKVCTYQARKILTMDEQSLIVTGERDESESLP